MDDVEEVIVKLVLALHLFYGMEVTRLSCSFYEDFREFMKLDALILLLQWFQTVSLLDPLYLLIVISAGRQRYFLDLPSVHDRILGRMEINDVILDLREELTDLQQLRKYTLALRGGLADAGFIVLPQQCNIPCWQFLLTSLFRRSKALTDLELHKRQNDDIAEVLNDPISLDEHFSEIGQ